MAKTVTATQTRHSGEWGATYSVCERYRYRLWRTWDASLPTVAFCLLNPSTATEFKNDPTIERCMRRAIQWGYGRLEIVNVFALRSTDPRALYDSHDPVGKDNFDAIATVAREAKAIICGWGGHGSLYGVGDTIKTRLQEFYPGKLCVLEVNKDGSPKHPLYIGYDVKPKAWT